MDRRKTSQDLTIKNNFMFGAVMSVEENCIGFLELVFGIEIDRIVISKEKSIVYHPEYKGVRLDIYARDENNAHYVYNFLQLLWNQNRSRDGRTLYAIAGIVKR